MTEGSVKSDRSAEKDRQRVEAFEKELANDAASLAFIPLAEALNRLAEWDRAAAVARRGLEAHPRSVAGLLTLAVAEAGRDNVKEALELIKSALILDQENPRALSLMGSLLLQKGLAKRALQFLTQAAKLDPESREIADLHKRAKRLAKLDAAVQLPVVRGENVPAIEGPWGAEEGSEATEAGGESEHTVFGPGGPPKAAPPGFRALGGGSDDEVTHALGQVRVPGEEGTEDGAPRRPSGAPRKPKMGGSAAEHSRLMQGMPEQETVFAKDAKAMRRASAPPTASDEEETKFAARVAGSGPKAAAAEPPKDSPKDPPKEPEVAPAKEAAPEPPAAPAAPAEAAAPAPAPPAEEKPRKKKGAPPPEAAPPPPSADRPATMMVDDAIWALTGGEKPSASPKVEAPKKAAEPEAGARPGVVVVQSSRWLGSLTFAATALVLAAGVGVLGYAMAASRSGKSAIESSEELRGLVADLERGDLAALLSAEEAAEGARNLGPELAPVLAALTAEVEARLWEEFGRAERARRAAEQALALAVPSVESAVARVALSTSSAALDALDAELARSLERHPASPKAWVLRAKVARRLGRPTDALRALARARELDPARRETLLELARWHVARGSAASAFALYDELVERYPSDVAALLERFVLHQVTGADADAGQVTSMLAALVREETPEVAKDEGGRVSLVFALLALGEGDVPTALGHLARAESAFPESAAFKAAVAGVLLSIGEWERAKAAFERAAELEPTVPTHRLGATLAGFGKAAGLVRPEALGAHQVRGNVTLPFGVVRYVPGRFELVEVEPRADTLPVVAFTAGGAEQGGAELLARASVLRGRGKLDEALELLEAAPKRAGVFLELGRVLAAKGDAKGAISAYKSALSGKPDALVMANARVGLAEALVDKGELGPALTALEPLAESEVVMPRALRLLASLRLRKDDAKGARAALERARTLDPDDPATERALGAVEHELGDGEAALGHYKRALELSRTLASETKGLSAVDAYYLGRLAFEKNEKRALLLWEKALDGPDAPPELHFHLGKAWVKKPKTKRQGLKELQKFRSLVGSGPLHDEAGRLMKGR